jgi:Tfp pilus assembly protein PilO
VLLHVFTSIIFACSVDRDGADVGQKVEELRNKLASAREQIERLPGIDQSPEDQRKHIEVLRKQLVSKTELLKKYKNQSNFNLDK